jgi:chromate transport protein ChrA
MHMSLHDFIFYLIIEYNFDLWHKKICMQLDFGIFSIGFIFLFFYPVTIYPVYHILIAFLFLWPDHQLSIVQ